MTEGFAVEFFLFLEVLIGGLMSGVMYSLVALGFVLIFKASGVFNFAQGAFVLFAALTFVSLLEMALVGASGVWFVVCLLATLAAMALYGVAVERVVLRPLVNQPLIILFMATIGLNFFTEGFAQLAWGTEVHALDIGIPDEPWGWLLAAAGMYITLFDMAAAAIAGALVLALSLFFSRTRTGRALRAVSDDHQAAMSVGIPLQHIWAVTWGVAGAIGLIAGVLWGAKLGVHFSLALLALKALPVLIIGGFDSIAGAIVGGLIVGTGEKLAEFYLSDFVGGALENWFPYILATLFLLARPQGLFGERIIERV